MAGTSVFKAVSSRSDMSLPTWTEPPPTPVEDVLSTEQCNSLRAEGNLACNIRQLTVTSKTYFIKSLRPSSCRSNSSLIPSMKMASFINENGNSQIMGPNQPCFPDDKRITGISSMIHGSMTGITRSRSPNTPHPQKHIRCPPVLRVGNLQRHCMAQVKHFLSSNSSNMFFFPMFSLTFRVFGSMFVGVSSPFWISLPDGPTWTNAMVFSGTQPNGREGWEVG